MTEPEPNPPPPEPTEPAPDGPQSPPEPPPEPEPPEDTTALKAALERERAARKAAEGKLAKATRATMTEQEQALDAARAEGRTEANRAAGLKVARAELRAALTGKVADPARTAELVDLARYVGDDGDTDSDGIAEAAGTLAASLAPSAGNGPGPARVPAGPREPVDDGDFLGNRLRGR